MAGALGGDGEAVKLARQPDGEVADVDHLLHLAHALGQDLAVLEGDQAAQGLLVAAQFVTEKTDQLAAARRRYRAPGEEGLLGTVDLLFQVARGVDAQTSDGGAVDGRVDGEVAAAQIFRIEAEGGKELLVGHGFYS